MQPAHVCFLLFYFPQVEKRGGVYEGEGLGVISQLRRWRHLHSSMCLAVVMSNITAQSTMAKRTVDAFFSPAPGPLQQQTAEVEEDKSDKSDSGEAVAAKKG